MSLLIDALKKGHKRNSDGVADHYMKEPKEPNRTGRIIVILLIAILLLVLAYIGLYLYHLNSQQKMTPESGISSEVNAANQDAVMAEPDQQPANEEENKEEVPAVVEPSGDDIAESKDQETAKPAEEEMSVVYEGDKNLKQRYADALEAINVQNYSQAISLLSDDDLTVETQGQSAVALTQAYLTIGDMTGAEEAVRSALKLHTAAQGDLDGLLGQILFEEGQYEEAAKVLKGYSPSINTNPGYYGLLARTYLKLGKPKLAINLFQQLIVKQSNELAWWIGLALALQEDGQYTQAQLAYGRALKMKTNDPQVRLFIQKELSLMSPSNQGTNDEQSLSG